MTGTNSGAQYQFVARRAGAADTLAMHVRAQATFPLMRSQDSSDEHQPNGFAPVQGAWPAPVGAKIRSDPLANVRRTVEEQTAGRASVASHRGGPSAAKHARAALGTPGL